MTEMIATAGTLLPTAKWAHVLVNSCGVIPVSVGCLRRLDGDVIFAAPLPSKPKTAVVVSSRAQADVDDNGEYPDEDKESFASASEDEGEEADHATNDEDGAGAGSGSEAGAAGQDHVMHDDVAGQ